MPQPLIGVEIDDGFQDMVKEEWVRAIAQLVLEQEVPEGTPELGILVTGDDEVRKLNRQYRNIDSTTDVLSFALAEGAGFMTPPDGLVHLGEIIVSYPQAERQALEEGKDTSQEVSLLLVHGLLHLLGYNHADPEEEQQMRAREKVLLQAISQGNPA